MNISFADINVLQDGFSVLTFCVYGSVLVCSKQAYLAVLLYAFERRGSLLRFILFSRLFPYFVLGNNLAVTRARSLGPVCYGHLRVVAIALGFSPIGVIKRALRLND